MFRAHFQSFGLDSVVSWRLVVFRPFISETIFFRDGIVNCDAILSDVLVLGELIISVNCSLNLLNCSFLVVNKVASFDLIKRGLHDLYR